MNLLRISPLRIPVWRQIAIQCLGDVNLLIALNQSQRNGRVPDLRPPPIGDLRPRRRRCALARLRHATWVARDGGSEFHDRLRAFGGFVKTPIATCAPTCPAAPDVKREAEEDCGRRRATREGWKQLISGTCALARNPLSDTQVA